MANMDPNFRMETQPGKGYVLTGKIMLIVIVALFILVLLTVGFHLYIKWYLARRRHRRRQLDRSRMQRGGPAHFVVYADNQRVDRGLDKKVLHSLPVYTYSSGTEPPPECAVCLSEFEQKDVVRDLPKCNHSFHIECIDVWFNSHSTCPLCRSPVEPVVVNPDKRKTIVSKSESVNREPESGSSSDGEPGVSCPDIEGSGGSRKGAELVSVKIEISGSRSESSEELAQSSAELMPTLNRLRSLKRIFSINIKSSMIQTRQPTDGPGGLASVDLEMGLGLQSRVQG